MTSLDLASEKLEFLTETLPQNVGLEIKENEGLL
jgi:hypothetical protein